MMFAFFRSPGKAPTPARGSHTPVARSARPPPGPSSAQFARNIRHCDEKLARAAGPSHPYTRTLRRQGSLKAQPSLRKGASRPTDKDGRRGALMPGGIHSVASFPAIAGVAPVAKPSPTPATLATPAWMPGGLQPVALPSFMEANATFVLPGAADPVFGRPSGQMEPATNEVEDEIFRRQMASMMRAHHATKGLMEQREEVERVLAERKKEAKMARKMQARQERERLARAELARQEAERLELERLAREEAQRAEIERLHRERMAREAAEREARRQEQERQRLAREAEAKARAEQERLVKEAEAKARAEQERLVKEAEAKARAEQERLVKEAEAKARAEQEKLAREAEEKARAEQERLAMLAAMQAERERAEKEAAELLQARFSLYEAKWKVLRDGVSSGFRKLHAVELPWPILCDVSSPDDITEARVAEFLLHPARPEVQGKSHRLVLKLEAVRWHSDRFDTKVLPVVVEEEQEKAAEVAGHVTRILTNFLMNIN
ncbi:hypothetical protein PLEOSDRAFT_164955 [Pleurotus ostreatus PC15]|uniref:Uncharacterized protein n=1 Tax=Pleurotus ostreatus (strain PC15) TaxID=1137138 RepID=A0A067P9V3_PLEO1|nr:hypothetical protein PLEOSDRAFT_164955 [Pleurotus ostreatus PC15]